jgi:uncharacterized protein (DUF1697 family)
VNRVVGRQNKNMNTFVILLRGITPTGKNKVLMAPLRAALTKAGLKDVQTYIQSGNVVARSSLPFSELEKLVHEVIRKNFGGEIAVLARTPDQFYKILKLNPFKEENGKRLYFSLLSTDPDKELLIEFLSTDFSPDQVQYVGNTIYTLYATKHSDSKFNNNYFERKLKVTATTRNLNTMTKLVTIASAQQSAPTDAKKRRG